MKSRNRTLASVLGVVLVSHQLVTSQEPEVAKPAKELEKPEVVAEKPAVAVEQQPAAAGDAEPVLPPITPIEPGDLPAIEPAAEPPNAKSKLSKDFVVTRASADPSSPEIPLAGITIYRDQRTSVKEKQMEPPNRGPGIFILEGLTTPSPDELRGKLSGFIGKTATYRDLEKIDEIILAHYSAHNRPMTHVYIPFQPLGAVMRFAVVEGRVGNAFVVTEPEIIGKAPSSLKPWEKNFKKKIDQGSWWQSWYRDPYGDDDLRRELAPRLDKIRGRVVDTKEINALLSAANRSPWVHLDRPVEHPFREVDVVFTPPALEILGQTDLVFEVRDSRPLKFFMGYENNLTKQLGEDRMFLGAAWYDAFALGLDHQFAFQVFSAMDPSELIGATSSYVIPWKNTDQFTELYAAYASSKVNESIAGVSSDVEGTNLLFGGRHYFELPRMFGATKDSEPLGLDHRAKEWADPRREAFGLHHEVGAGFDYKNTDNNLLFGGTTASDTPADIIQFVVEYNARQTDPLGETNLAWQFFVSPGDITGNNTDEDFRQLRADSSATYFYSKVKLDREQDLPYHMMARAALTGQWADGNLLSSEQLGVGGFDSVRGYTERIHNGDIGYLFNFELYSPEFNPAQQWFKKNFSDSFRVLTFFDLGYGKSSQDSVSDPLDDSSTLMSIGLGFRYEFENNLRIRVDYGFQLRDSLPAADNSGNGAFHLGAVWTF